MPVKFDKVETIEHLTVNAPCFSVHSNCILPDVSRPTLTWNVKDYTVICKSLKIFKKIDMSKQLDLLNGFKVDDLVLYANGIFADQDRR